MSRCASGNVRRAGISNVLAVAGHRVERPTPLLPTHLDNVHILLSHRFTNLNRGLVVRELFHRASTQMEAQPEGGRSRKPVSDSWLRGRQAETHYHYRTHTSIRRQTHRSATALASSGWLLPVFEVVSLKRQSFLDQPSVFRPPYSPVRILIWPFCMVKMEERRRVGVLGGQAEISNAPSCYFNMHSMEKEGFTVGLVYYYV